MKLELGPRTSQICSLLDQIYAQPDIFMDQARASRMQFWEQSIFNGYDPQYDSELLDYYGRLARTIVNALNDSPQVLYTEQEVALFNLTDNIHVTLDVGNDAADDEEELADLRDDIMLEEAEISTPDEIAFLEMRYQELAFLSKCWQIITDISFSLYTRVSKYGLQPGEEIEPLIDVLDQFAEGTYTTSRTNFYPEDFGYEIDDQTGEVVKPL